MNGHVDPFERHSLPPPLPPPPAPSRIVTFLHSHERRRRSLDFVVRHAFALGSASLVGLIFVVGAFIWSWSALDACDAAGRTDCNEIADQQVGLMLVVLAIAAVVALLAVVGAIRGLVVGLPGDRSRHWVRNGFAILASLPMNAITVLIVGAWFVHWFRS